LDGAFGSILLHKTEKSIENDDRANWGRIQIVTEQRGNRRGNDQNDDHERRELFLTDTLCAFRSRRLQFIAAVFAESARGFVFGKTGGRLDGKAPSSLR
jgi:hypothetical protein